MFQGTEIYELREDFCLMANTEEKCAHEMCSCPKANDSDYCSQQCSDAAGADVTGIMCECGHPGCSNG